MFDGKVRAGFGGAEMVFADQVARGRGPIWIMKSKSRVEQDARNHAPAFQNQLSLRTEEKRAQLQHPPGCRQPKGNTARMAKMAHEFRIGQRVGRADIDWTLKLLVRDEKVQGARKVGVMYP